MLYWDMYFIGNIFCCPGQTHEDPVDIAWSDSDSEEGSDYDTREKHQTRADAQQQQQQRLHPRPSTHIQSFTKALFMNVTDKGKLCQIYIYLKPDRLMAYETINLAVR